MIASLIAPTITTNTITNTRNSVLTPRRSTTAAARREPLRTINMPASQAQARVASSSAKGGKTKRTSARLLEREDKDDESADEWGSAVNGYRHTGGGKKEQQSAKEKSKKRKADYDEKVDDFVFSRAEPKKQKPSAVSSVTFTEPPITEEPGSQSQQQAGQKRKTRAKATDSAVNSTPSTRSQRKTSKQNSVEPREASEEPRRTRRKVDHSDPAPSKTKKKKNKVDETKDPDRMRDVEMNGNHTPQQEEKGSHATTIALPFADTPVISRNKEMRQGKGKGQRRSSLGMRGRRASSLIDSGESNALPHDKVSTADFYKHIGNEGLPEPRRMRQLLTWCATRAIGEKPSGSRSEDESARLAARVIQEELLKEFSNRSELSDWFSREESAPPKVVVKKPNPKNIQNAEKVKELEKQIHRLQEERQALSALLRPPSIPPTTKPLAPPQEPQDGERYPASQQRRKPQPEPIDPSLLHPSQHPFLNVITPTPTTHHQPRDRDQEKQKQRPRHREPNQGTPQSQSQPHPQQEEQQEDTSTSSSSHHPSQISTRLSRLASSLPSTIDAFASGIHDIDLYRDAADRVAGRVLGICAKRLEERDRVLGGRWDGDESRSQSRSSNSNSEDMDTEESDRKGKGRERERDRGEEDISLVLGALSRVERR